MTSSGTIPDWLVIVIAALASVSFVAIKQRWFLKYQAPTIALAPVLLAYFTEGDAMMSAGKHELKNVAGGAIRNDIITIPKNNGEGTQIGVDAGVTLVVVELPFRAELHLLAIAKDPKMAQLRPTYGGSIMERVELEGDFGDYFTLYADKGQQEQARYIVDPSAMAFVVDFCKHYHWEIIDDTICFAAKDSLPDDDIITKFIAQIRSSVAPSALHTSRYEPKVTTWPIPSKFLCPVCQEHLNQYRFWHECSNGHGQLIQGGYLADMKLRGDTFTPAETDEPVQHTVISCPSCGQQMEPVAYGGSKIIIDTCLHCQYRWIDAGELQKILNNTGRV